ncbi:MAG: hypothetical protein JWM80_164 [Cyanobacteria bacterium RYN_339]|nr:hypothetical protein [Cyanobacteria bacterium RYN_339]
MGMNVSAVGNYGTNRPGANSALTQPYAAAGQPSGGLGYDQYQSSAVQPAATSGISIGRALSWAAGGFATFKWVLPLFRAAANGNPAWWLTAGVLGAGALAGNWIYGKLTGS